jgi:quercetin dioxygenase-like cupin family protein
MQSEESASEGNMICMNYKDVAPIQVKKINYQGKDFEVKGASIRWLTHKNLGGDEYQHNHALRHFTVAPKGEVPIHQHKYTQIMYVLSGKALSTALSKDGDKEEREIGPGDFVYNYSLEPHGLKNLSDAEPVVFLCCIDCVGDKENCAPSY